MPTAPRCWPPDGESTKAGATPTGPSVPTKRKGPLGPLSLRSLDSRRSGGLGLFADRELPDWLLRHLRYTPVAVFPALVAPLVAWPAATGGTLDPARLAAALTTIGVGYYWRNPLYAFLAGFGTLWIGLALS